MFLPQETENNTPQLQDVAGECSMYDEFMTGILARINRVSEYQNPDKLLSRCRMEIPYKRKLNLQTDLPHPEYIVPEKRQHGSPAIHTLYGKLILLLKNGSPKTGKNRTMNRKTNKTVSNGL
jgi:hypothetical protein